MTADERISKLLERAGCPMMIVRNEDNHTIKPMAYATIAEAVSAYCDEVRRDSIDTIERLAAALENVINERDQLLCDLKEVDILCEFCANKDTFDYFAKFCVQYENDCTECPEYGNCPCMECGKSRYRWRGVPDKEE